MTTAQEQILRNVGVLVPSDYVPATTEEMAEEWGINDLPAYQRKIDAAQSMATMIKRFLEHYEHEGNHDYRRRTKALRESLEAYRNA